MTHQLFRSVCRRSPSTIAIISRSIGSRHIANRIHNRGRRHTNSIGTSCRSAVAVHLPSTQTSLPIFPHNPSRPHNTLGIRSPLWFRWASFDSSRRLLQRSTSIMSETSAATAAPADNGTANSNDTGNDSDKKRPLKDDAQDTAAVTTASTDAGSHKEKDRDDGAHAGNDGGKQTTKEGNAPTNKRRKTRKDRKEFNRTWRSSTDNGNANNASNNNGGKPPHQGSYASSVQREMFHETLEDRTPFTEKTSKKKIAMLIGFLGTKYVGFQINIGQRTLQAHLELALYKAGMINDTNFGHPFKYSWGNSARTDKGVHACAQLCSLKVELPEGMIDDYDAIRERIHQHLPEDIRILDVVRTTRNFCAKTQRDKARYQYMFPSFMLHAQPRKLFEQFNIPLKGRKEVARQPLSAEEMERLKPTLREYRSTQEQRDVLRQALSKYEGTHSFHNFTKGVRFGEATAKRFIVSFEVQDPIVVDDIEWIPTQVVGQSFLLHQIRKMISMAMDVARGVAPVDTISRAQSKESIRVGLAPAQGLFLEFSWYAHYNQKKIRQNPNLPDLDWTKEGPARDRWEAFRTRIREHIVREEKEQSNFIQYLYQQECIFDYRTYYRLDEAAASDGLNANEDAKKADAE